MADVQIDPQTGERVQAQIDPATGERIAAPKVSGLPEGESLPAVPKPPSAMQPISISEALMHSKGKLANNVGPGGAINYAVGAGEGLRDLAKSINPVTAIPNIPENAKKIGTSVLDASPVGSFIPGSDQRLRDTLSSTGHDLAIAPAETAGRLTGPAIALHGAQSAIEGAGSGIQSALRPESSPGVVSPAEMASRKLSAAVLPATKDASNFIKAAPLEVPNIREYAARTGNPMKTQLEFSKAAQGSAGEARDYYENKILKPNDKLVDTTGTGFGDRSGEGPRASAKLSDIDKRVVEINKQLDKPSLNSDDARRALASKADLQAEASKLRDILHSNLSKATGLQPEDIQNLRQRVGRSYELGNDTDAAVTARMQAEGKTDQGPLAIHQIPAKLLETIRGGPTAIADRQFQRAIKNFPGQPQPLPTIRNLEIASPGPERAPIWQGVTSPSKPPVSTFEPDIAGAQKLVGDARTQKMMDLARTSDIRQAAKTAEEERMQGLLAPAKAIQLKARLMRNPTP